MGVFSKAAMQRCICNLSMMDEKCMSGKKRYPVHQTSVEDVVKQCTQNHKFSWQ
jgi:hypothetical protein